MFEIQLESRPERRDLELLIIDLSGAYIYLHSGGVLRATLRLCFSHTKVTTINQEIE